MDKRRAFMYNPEIDLTAAHIGINRWDWKATDTDNEEEAKKIMLDNKFDVLPVSDGYRSVEKYFCTRTWNNYDQLNLHSIELSDTIYYRLSFGDLVQKFTKERKYYYFLSDYQEVLGLVSIVNLNCQAVYHYLYQVISDIEQSIAYLLRQYLKQDELLSLFKNSGNTHLIDVAENFERSLSLGQDNNLFEHMYLQTIGITLKKCHHSLPVKCRALGKYSHKFSPGGTYGIIRNKIMHPVRPLLNDFSTIESMNELLHDYFRIREVVTS